MYEHLNKEVQNKFVDPYKKIIYSIADADKQIANNQSIGYVIGPDEALIDCDSIESVNMMEDTLTKLNVTTYSYWTNTEHTHKHYWFEINDTHKELFRRLKLTATNDFGKFRIFNKIEKAGELKIVNVETKASGIAYLNDSSKDCTERPNASLFNINKKTSMTKLPMFLVTPKDVLLKGAGEGWNMTLLAFIESMIRLKLYDEDICIAIQSDWAKYIGVKGDHRAVIKAFYHENMETLNEKLNDPFFQLLNYFDFKYYEGCVWCKFDNIWTNINKIWDNATDLNTAMNGRINMAAAKLGIKWPRDNKGNTKPIKYVQLKSTILNRFVENKFEGIVFKNGYVDRYGWHETDDIKFTTCQIKRNYNPFNKPTALIMKYLNGMGGSRELVVDNLIRVYASAMSSVNHQVLTLLMSEEGETGKTTFWKLLQNFMDSNVIELNDNIFSAKDGRFAFRGIQNRTLGVIDEFPKYVNMNGINVIKRITNPGRINIELKSSNINDTDNTITWLATSNYIPSFQTFDQPLDSRLVTIIVGKSPLTTEEFIELNNNAAKHISSILPLIVNQYVILANSLKSRRLKFDFNNDAIKQAELDDDPVTNWIIKNTRLLGGVTELTSTEILRLYMSSQSLDRSLPPLKTGASITSKMKTLGWTTGMGRDRRNYYPPEPGATILTIEGDNDEEMFEKAFMKQLENAFETAKNLTKTLPMKGDN